MHLAVEGFFAGAFLIIPLSRSWPGEVGDGAVLTSAAIVGFSGMPVAFAHGHAVGPRPFALMSSVSSADPLLSFGQPQVAGDSGMVVVDEDSAVLAADLDGIVEGRRRGEIFQESASNVGPALRICRRSRGYHQSHQGQARIERHDWIFESGE